MSDRVLSIPLALVFPYSSYSSNIKFCDYFKCKCTTLCNPGCLAHTTKLTWIIILLESKPEEIFDTHIDGCIINILGNFLHVINAIRKLSSRNLTIFAITSRLNNTSIFSSPLISCKLCNSSGIPRTVLSCRMSNFRFIPAHGNWIKIFQN